VKAFRNSLLALIVVLIAGHAFHYGTHQSVGFFLWSVHKDPETGTRELVRTSSVPEPALSGANVGDLSAEVTGDANESADPNDPNGAEAQSEPEPSTPEPEPEPEPEPTPPPPPSKFVLFDGKELGTWAPIQFGGEGETIVNEDGCLEFGFGAIMTGVHWSEDPPATTNYQIDLDAMKLDGNDFFCAVTFPVKDSHATLVIGGWGGGVVGISSVDDLDASENETMNIEGFENDVWYHVRIRVTDEKIEAWIDDRQMVDLELKDRKVSLRPGDIELCVPLGIASFMTRAQYKNIVWKNLNEEDLKNPPEPFKPAPREDDAPPETEDTPEPGPGVEPAPESETEAESDPASTPPADAPEDIEEEADSGEGSDFTPESAAV